MHFLSIFSGADNEALWKLHFRRIYYAAITLCIFEIVTGQIPRIGQSIPKGGKVVITTADAGAVTTTVVPDVKGMSAAEANDRLVNAGLNIRLSGSGYDSTQGVVVSQSIPAESTVESGTVITIEFIVSGATD